MPPVDRYKLRFGPYRTPRFRYGSTVVDEIRGEAIIAGLSDATIPWPVARLPGRSSRGLVIYNGLAKALRTESAVAVAEAWGVSVVTVSRWRNALGIDANTDGSRELRREHAEHNFPKVRPRLWSKLHDEAIHAKIAASKRGKPRPPHVIEAMRKANTGRKQSAATRRKRSETCKAQGILPAGVRPWTTEEDALLVKLSPAEVAKRTGRTLQAVRVRRSRLGR